MEKKKYKIGFFTPDNKITGEFFGAATFGIAVDKFGDIYADEYVFSSYELEGIKLAGTYDEVLQSATKAATEYDVKVAIVLTGNAGDENQFLTNLSTAVKCPIVGGGAAINLETGKSALLDEVGSEASVLFITDNDYEFETSYLNIHTNVVSEHCMGFRDNRVLDTIDGEPAAKWLDDKKMELGFSSTDFEHVTFATTSGINAHLSMNDGKICSGRDLEESMVLRYIDKSDVDKVMQRFYQDSDAIIFGCAGLRGILNAPIITNSIGLFMFGEICYVNNEAEFGNLMLSKIKINKLA